MTESFVFTEKRFYRDEEGVYFRVIINGIPVTL